MVRKPSKTQLIQPSKPKSNKKAKFDDKNYYDKKPRHLYRGMKGKPYR